MERWLCTDCEQTFTDPVGPQNRCHRCGGARTMRSRRWRDGERLYVENDFVTMVYVATEDASKHGLGLHGDDQMCVIYISTAAAAPWLSLPNGDREAEAT